MKDVRINIRAIILVGVLNVDFICEVTKGCATRAGRACASTRSPKYDDMKSQCLSTADRAVQAKRRGTSAVGEILREFRAEGKDGF